MTDFLTHCQTILNAVNAQDSLPLTLFLVAFFGGFAHCAFMCGPFVVMQNLSYLKNTDVQNMNELTRLKGVLLLPYHIGRLTTYVLLGVVAYCVGDVFNINMHAMGYALLTAGFFYLLSLFKINVLPTPAGLGGFLAKFAEKLAKKPTGFSGYFYGVVLGFLPCGMVYAALASMVGAESLSVAVLSMVCFALGTIPGLVVVGILSHLGAQSFGGKIKKVAKMGGFITAFWLVVFGLFLVL